jgi:hypothetical protein
MKSKFATTPWAASFFAAILFSATLSVTPTARAQTPTQPADAERTTADPEDVSSIEAITAAVYACISGEKGEERQWDRFRSLFHPSARLIPVQRTREGDIVATAMSIEDYIARVNSFFLENGFFEKEVHRVLETYGSIAHHFSTYNSYRSKNDDEPFARGINSFQLMHDGSRWWILNIFWQGETPDVPIPKKYLGM